MAQGALQSGAVGAGLALALLLLVAAPGAAQVIDPEAPGGWVALPVLTSGDAPGQRSTTLAVRNLDIAASRVLHVTWIDGETCSAIDFDCRLEPYQTGRFVFEAAGPTTLRVDYACSDGLGGLRPLSRILPGTDGLFVAAPEAAVPGLGDKTVPEDDLLATATILDSATGLAFTVSGIHAQAVPGPLGDRRYRFDGTELRFFPDALLDTYLAPDAIVDTELLLFTPDLRISGPPVRARLSGLATRDDGAVVSGSFEVDCFDLVPLDGAPGGFGPNVRGDGTGTRTGAFDLSPDATSRSDVHEFTPPVGDGNGARRPAVHGWKVESVGTGGLLPDFNLPMGSASLTPSSISGSVLGQSATPLAPLGLDVDALDAR